MSHAGAVAMLQGVPGKILCLVDGMKRIESVCHHAGNAGRQRAARAVVTVWQAVPGEGFHDAVRMVERVDDPGCLLVGAGDQDIFCTVVEQGKGARIQGIGLRCEQAGLATIGCDDRRQGHQQDAQ